VGDTPVRSKKQKEEFQKKAKKSPKKKEKDHQGDRRGKRRNGRRGSRSEPAPVRHNCLKGANRMGKKKDLDPEKEKKGFFVLMTPKPWTSKKKGESRPKNRWKVKERGNRMKGTFPDRTRSEQKKKAVPERGSLKRGAPRSTGGRRPSKSSDQIP